MVQLAEISEHVKCSPNELLPPAIRQDIEDVFKYYTQQNIRDDLRDKVNSLSVFVYEKSDEKACTYRLKGNELYKANQFEDAVKQYSQV